MAVWLTHLDEYKMAILQFKRVFNYAGSFDNALYNIQHKLNPALHDGEPLMCSYQDGSDIKFFVAVGAGEGRVVVHPTFSSQDELIAYIKKHAGTSSDLKDLISEDSDFVVNPVEDGRYVFKIKEDILNTAGSYKPGNGISITEGTISVVVDPNDEFIQVTESGLSTKKLSDTIAEIKVTDVDYTVNNGISLTKNENGVIGVSVNVSEITEAILNNEDNLLVGTTIKLGQSIVDKDTQSEIAKSTASVYDAIQAVVDHKFETQAGITALRGDKYITIEGDSTVKTIGLDVAKIGTYLVDDYSALKVNSSTGELSVEWEDIDY